MFAGLVIANLADIAVGKKPKDTYIPYRDFILTWLLKENLGQSPTDLNHSLICIVWR